MLGAWLRFTSGIGKREASPDLLADPGILPRHRDVLVVPAKQEVDAIAITDFYRLMLVQAVGASYSYPGPGLPSFQVLYPAQARDSAEPQVTVEREPQLRLHIIAQVSFEGADGSLRLRFRKRN